MRRLERPVNPHRRCVLVQPPPVALDRQSGNDDVTRRLQLLLSAHDDGGRPATTTSGLRRCFRRKCTRRRPVAPVSSVRRSLPVFEPSFRCVAGGLCPLRIGVCPDGRMRSAVARDALPQAEEGSTVGAIHRIRPDRFRDSLHRWSGDISRRFRLRLRPASLREGLPDVPDGQVRHRLGIHPRHRRRRLGNLLSLSVSSHRHHCAMNGHGRTYGGMRGGGSRDGHGSIIL